MKENPLTKFLRLYKRIKTVFVKPNHKQPDLEVSSSRDSVRVDSVQIDIDNIDVKAILSTVPEAKMFDRYRDEPRVREWIKSVWEPMAERYAMVMRFISNPLRNSLMKNGVNDWRSFWECRNDVISGESRRRELALVKQLLGIPEGGAGSSQISYPAQNADTIIPKVQLAALAMRSKRTADFLSKHHALTYGDLFKIDEWDVRAAKNCGTKAWEEILHLREMGHDGSLFEKRLDARAYKTLAEYILGAWKLFEDPPDKKSIAVLGKSMGLLNANRYWSQREITSEMGYDAEARASVNLVESHIRKALFNPDYTQELFADFTNAVRDVFMERNGICDANVAAARVDRLFGWKDTTKWSLYNLCVELEIPLERPGTRNEDFDVLTWTGMDQAGKESSLVQLINEVTTPGDMSYSSIRAGFLRNGFDELTLEEYFVYSRKILKSNCLNPRKQKIFRSVVEGRKNASVERKLLLKDVMSEAVQSGHPCLTKGEICSRCQERLPADDWPKLFKTAFNNGDLDGNGSKIITYDFAYDPVTGKKSCSFYTLNICWDRPNIRRAISDLASDAIACLRFHNYPAITIDKLWDRYKVSAENIPSTCAYFLMRDQCKDKVLCPSYPFVQLPSAKPIGKNDHKKTWGDAVRIYFSELGVKRIKDLDIKKFVNEKLFYDTGSGVPATDLQKDTNGTYIIE